MARPLRITYPGAFYHITSRGNERKNIFKSQADREKFLSYLESATLRYDAVIHVYCLMSNHYHLLLETPDGNLSKGMRQLNGVYTQYINRSQRRVGHLFQGRYKGILVQKENYLLELARYIVLNPVRAQLVRSARDWPWSSYRATAGQSAGPNCLQTDWILAAFGKRKQQAIDGYKRFVAEGKGQPSPWQELAHQVYLGSEAFIEKVQSHLDLDKDLDEIPSSQKRPAARPLEEYQTKYKSRNAAIFEAYRSGGYTLKDIGKHFGLHYSTVSGIIKNHKLKT